MFIDFAKMADPSGESEGELIGASQSTVRQYCMTVEPPIFKSLFFADDTDIDGIDGNYQFGIAGPLAICNSLKALNLVRDGTRGEGYCVLTVAKLSNREIKKQVEKNPTLILDHHPGGMVVEIVSSFWISECRKMVLLPPTRLDSVLYQEFLKSHWLPQPTWEEFNIRPAEEESNLFVQDREYIF